MYTFIRICKPMYIVYCTCSVHIHVHVHVPVLSVHHNSCVHVNGMVYTLCKYMYMYMLCFALYCVVFVDLSPAI